MAAFIPRATFPTQLSLPRSYYLGHHAAGLSKMKTMLSSIDLIIECRDYRVPITSRNPLFEESLAGRERLIVYTKRDLGSRDRPSDLKVVHLHVPSRKLIDNREKALFETGMLPRQCCSAITNPRRTSSLYCNMPKRTPKLQHV